MLNLYSRCKLSSRDADVLIRCMLIQIPCSFMQRLDAAAGRMRKAEEGGRRAVGVVLGKCGRGSAPFLASELMGETQEHEPAPAV